MLKIQEGTKSAVGPELKNFGKVQALRVAPKDSILTSICVNPPPPPPPT